MAHESLSASSHICGSLVTAGQGSRVPERILQLLLSFRDPPGKEGEKGVLEKESVGERRYAMRALFSMHA